jgi:AAA domain
MSQTVADLLHHLDAPPEADSWTPINLNQLPAKPPIEPTLGNTGLLYPGKRHVFSGPPDSAKTIAAYCTLIAIIRTGHTAILIDFEMGSYDARQRLQELGATSHELEHLLYIEPAERATLDRISHLIDYEPDLVVVDAAAGAYGIQGLDDNKRGDVETLSALYVNSFWRRQIATLFIDHVVKDAEHRGRYAIGSERKLGGVDVHYGFDTIQPVSRGTTGRYKLVIHRDRGGYLKRGHIADLRLDSDPDTHQITWAFTAPESSTSEAGYFRPTHLMEKVSIDLEHRHEAVSRNTICETVGGTKDYVLKAIAALIIEGFAAEIEGDRRAKLVHSIRRYRENDPVDNSENGAGGPVVRNWFGSGSEPVNPESTGSANQFGTGSTDESLDIAENPLVPNQFGSGSASDCSSGSGVGSLRSKEPPESSASRPPESDDWFGGWFNANGELDDAYYDQIAPDPEDT